MREIEMELTGDDLNILAGVADGRGKMVRVDRLALAQLVMDHTRLMDAAIKAGVKIKEKELTLEDIL